MRGNPHAGGEKPVLAAGGHNGGWIVDIDSARPGETRAIGATPAGNARKSGPDLGAELSGHRRATRDLHTDHLADRAGFTRRIKQPFKPPGAVRGNCRRGLL